MVNQVPNTAEAVQLLKQLMLSPNEGVMYAKFVLLKQSTLTAGEAQSKIDSAPAAILLGDLGDIKAQLVVWLDEALRAYKS